jgi:hypothetical protein
VAFVPFPAAEEFGFDVKRAAVSPFIVGVPGFAWNSGSPAGLRAFGYVPK